MTRIVGFASLVVVLAACAQPLVKPSLERVPDADSLAQYAEPPRGRGRGSVERLGDNRFRAACPDFAAAATEQKDADLCWAACVESIEKYVLHRGRDQRAIAEEAGWVKDSRGADPTTIMLALNPSMQRAWTSRGAHQFKLAYPSSDRLIDAIASGNPVVVGMSEPGGGGHVWVAHAVTFAAKKKDRLLGVIPISLPRLTTTRGAQDCEWSIESIELFNPTPGHGTETMTADQVNERLDFFFDQGLARELLQEAMW